ncbi:hypothetical protein HN807_12240 [Candidatus Bathyarchaeota archaeon]|jgi:hypothetical protein|nr:hypothetical protein [Candidatus Bathyarchaeota archaeon]MBT4320426.1 hypothetical protein [Candidatus Bathyarchaeota archaeon]MBT4425224.1 hypothetical protein [Candidatus Bathyarchaeota archaeon]MBT6604354.1 hypothetical protein [Candidatus Bathyarchaeota archaeon]MBT7185920.1 hypothetical protein [Candidatus Bathyarchaeota archaeon]
MSDKINLKALERKAYLAYYEDGLLDMGIGAVLAWLGGVALTELDFPFYLWYILGVSVWTSAKKQITVPRMGYVKFRETRKGRVRKLIYVFILVLTFIMVIGVLLFKSTVAVETPGWIFVIRDYGDVIFGAIFLGGGLMSVGYTTEVKRFSYYGGSAFTLHLLNHFLTLNPTWDIWQAMAPVNLLLGIVMLGNGYMLLRKFKEKYPITGEPMHE